MVYRPTADDPIDGPTGDAGRVVGAPAVVVVDGEEASGLATMLADLLRDNLRDFPARARVASRARGSVVMRAADHDLDVTLTFAPDRIEIRDGATAGVTTVAGAWLAMAQLCSGRLSPLVAVRRGELTVTRGRGLITAAAAGYVLSVPESFYAAADGPETGSGEERRSASPVVVIAAVGAGSVAGLVVVAALRRRRQRRGAERSSRSGCATVEGSRRRRRSTVRSR